MISFKSFWMGVEHASALPAKGGSLLTVIGRGFRATSSYYCRLHVHNASSITVPAQLQRASPRTRLADCREDGCCRVEIIMLVSGVLYATIIGQMPILSLHAGVLAVRPTVLALSLVVPLTVLESLEVVLVRCSLTHSLARSLPLPLPPTNPHPPTPSLISISI